MSIKKEWQKLRARLKAWWELNIAADDPDEANAGTGYEYPWGASNPHDELYRVPELPVPSLASCWENGAKKRHMNLLSFAFTDDQVESRLDWAAKRGCNTVHFLLCNQADGEGAGYNIYSGEPSFGKPDAGSVSRMLKRIGMARKRGLAVVLWLLTDDSERWNKAILAAPERYVADLKLSGLLDYADAVVLGLEMDETKDGNWAGMARAIRGVYHGKIGTHHRPGHSEFAALGDLFFLQTSDSPSVNTVKSAVSNAKKHGKPVVAFELAREPRRDLAQAAIDAGAVGVGNW